MQARARSKTAISFEQKAEIFRELFALGDRTYEFMDQMRGRGFSAFLPRERFLQSLARNPEELADHHTYIREWSSWMFALDTDIADRTGRFRQLCYPDGLKLLEEKRDKLNGVPYADLQQAFSDDCIWRKEIDPCRRHEWYMIFHDNERFKALDKKWRDDTSRIFASEVQRHSTELSRGYAMWSLVIRDRLVFCRELMKRELTRLGFRYDRSRSSYVSPVFSKTIIKDWDLCFGLSESERLFGDAYSGSFSPSLALRHRSDRGDLHPAKALLINYAYPCRSPSAYCSFKSIAGLETIMRAYFCLYDLMAPELESILARALPSVVAA